MGLDMSVFRCTLPTIDDKKIYRPGELSGIVLPENEIERDMFYQLSPYCVKVQIRNKRIDMDRMRQDYRLSRKAYLCMIKGSEIGICDGDTRITIDEFDIDTRYAISRVETGYYTRKEEIAYWRKAYEIQDWFHENLLQEVENERYYLLDEDTLMAFNEEFPGDALPVIRPTKESALFYWEWY